jgi:MscS family membrane protein
VDTSSPRATFTGFLEAMNQAVTLYRNEGDREGARQLALDAVRCLDLREVPPTVADTVGLETALRLKEVLDRIPVPSRRSIPNAAQMEEKLTGSWTIPDTPIAIAQVEEGPRAGEYLFSPETVARSEEFYERVRDLPYRPRTGKGAHYEEYQVAGGEFLRRWVVDLPDWAKKAYKGQAVWQWAGLVLCLAIGSALTALIYVGGRRLAASRERLGVYVLPVTLMATAVLFESVAREIHLTGGIFTAVTLLLTGLLFLSGVRLVAVALGQIADLVISTAQLRPRGVDSQLVRLAFRIVIIAVTAALVIVAADQLGLPAYSLLTGLGIGGLAVALAARETLANFLASVVIMFERPFRVGDWIKVAGQEGNVEDIGFRSTRIRTFYNSVVTIPSSEMVGTSIDNMGMRRYRRVRTVVQVTYDTPSEKIEAFVEGVKEIIRTHPTTRKDYFHVVFNDFGAHSLDILLYFFIVAPDWSVELVERQKVLLEIVRLAERLGVSFAFPTQTVHVESLPDVSGDVVERSTSRACPRS